MTARHVRRSHGSTHCPFMPVFGAAAGDVRARPAAPSCGTPTASATSTSSCGLAVTSLGHANPAVAEAIADAGARRCCTSATSSPTRRRRRGGDRDQRAAAPRPPGTTGRSSSCNSGAEANECAHQAGPQVRRPRPPRGRQRARQLPRAHARRAGRHRPAGQARAVPADARGLPPRRLRRPRRARARRSTRSVAAVLHRAGAGRGRRQPGAARLPRGDPRSCATSAGALMMVDEIQTGFGRTGRVVRLRARRRRARRRDDGQGDGQRHARSARAGRARDVAAVFQPGDHGSTYSGTAIATAAVSAVIAEMRRIDAPALAARAGRPPARPARSDCRRRRGPRPGPAARRRARRASTRTAVYRDAARPRARRQRGHADRAALRPAAHRHRRRDRRGGRRSSATCSTGAGVTPRTCSRSPTLDGRRGPRRCSTSPSVPPASLGRPLDGPGRGADLREAVEPHPPLDGDGRRPARRPPGLHAGRGGRLRRARAGRGRRPDPGATTPSSRPGCSTTTCSSGWPPSPTCRSSTCCPTTRTRCRRSPTR